jgi:fructokinase
MKIVSIGAVLWDVFPEVEHIGGAPLNFSAHAAKLGHDVVLVSAVGDDGRGTRALQRIAELGLTSRFVDRVQGVPTGTVTVALDSYGNPSYTIHRPAAYDFLELSDADLQAISLDQPEWIYYGTLEQLSPRVRDVTTKLVSANPRAARLYDINLRVDSYHSTLVRELMCEASVLKINEEEIRLLMEMFRTRFRSLEAFCRDYSEEFGWKAVCVTRGENGCCLLLSDEYIEHPGYKANVVDTVGAGDAFAAAFVHGISSGWPAEKIADFATRLGAFVVSHRGAVPSWNLSQFCSTDKAAPEIGTTRQI